MLYYVIMWFLMSFFSYVSSTIAGAVARLGERKERKARVCRRSLSRCLAVSLPSAFRYQPGGPQRKPPKKKGGRAGSNTHIHTLSPSRCVPVNACHVDILCRNI